VGRKGSGELLERARPAARSKDQMSMVVAGRFQLAAAITFMSQAQLRIAHRCCR
jgi:hypothetical protein